MRVHKEHRRTDSGEEAVDPPRPVTVEKKDTSEIDDLLDRMDDLLADSVAEREAERKRAWREKILSIAHIGQASVPCRDLVSVPNRLVEHYVEVHGAEVYDGPPCVDC